MKIGRITQIVLGVVSSGLFLSMPLQLRAQEIREISPTRCTGKQTETDGRALPVARTDGEYKIYCNIVALQSPEELITKGQLFLEEHDQSDLRFPIYQHLVTSAIRLNNFDLAFEMGRKAIEEFPDHVLVKTQLATVAGNLMLMGNNKYADEGMGYACEALSFIQEEKTPYGYTLDQWRTYREGLRGDIYQAMGIFSLLSDCPEDSINALTRAVELNPNQPYSYFLIAKAQVRLYQLGNRKALVTKRMESSTKQPETLLEQIAKSYAYVSVLTENEQYKLLREAAEYDMQILSNALGQSIKAEFARSIETAKSETNARLKPPTAAVSTVRP
jgi:hypothetical protein